MRRTRQQIPHEEVVEILKRGQTGILAVNGDGGYPYTVPLNYVYKDGKIYFHCARAGHKFDALAQDDRVSFCVIDKDDVAPERLATDYISVVAFGRARLLEGSELEQAAYELGIKYYDNPPVVRAEVESTKPRLACFEITVEHMTGKEGIALMLSRSHSAKQ